MFREKRITTRLADIMHEHSVIDVENSIIEKEQAGLPLSEIFADLNDG